MGQGVMLAWCIFRIPLTLAPSFYFGCCCYHFISFRHIPCLGSL